MNNIVIIKMVEAACPSYEGSVNNYPRPGHPLVGFFWETGVDQEQRKIYTVRDRNRKPEKGSNRVGSVHILFLSSISSNSY